MNVAEFRLALNPGALRTMRIIHLGLMGGIALFTLIVLYLYASGSDAGGVDEQPVMALSLILVALYPSAFAVGRIVAEKRYAAARKELLAGSTTTALEAIRTTMLIRSALIEGVTYLALFVLLISITNGILYTQPMYLWNLAYPCLTLIYFAVTFPTAERIEAVFTEKLTGIG